MTKNQQLAKGLKCGLFADRETVKEAFEYAYEVLKNNPAGITALHVVVNTIANTINENEEEEVL